MNLGTLLLQWQVPAWLGKFEYIMPNHTPESGYANNQVSCFTCICTCGGIHQGRVEPTSLIELTTSWIDALNNRRSCTSSLETFAQSFLHRALPKRSGEGLQAGLDRGCPLLQLASSSPAPRARRCGQKCVLDHITVWRSWRMTKPTRHSLVGLYRYAGEAEAVPKFSRWYAISMSNVYNAVDAVIAKYLQHPFVGHPYWIRLAAV